MALQFLSLKDKITLVQKQNSTKDYVPLESAKSFQNLCEQAGLKNKNPTVYISIGRGKNDALFSVKENSDDETVKSLGESGTATLILPTDLDLDNPEDRSKADKAIADIYKALGFGCNLALIETPDLVKALEAKLLNNSKLAKYYKDHLDDLKAATASNDMQKFFATKSWKNGDFRVEAFIEGVTAETASEQNRPAWFQRKIVTPTPSPSVNTESPEGKTTPSLISAEGDGNCAFNSVFLALLGEIAKGTFEDLTDTRKKQVQDRFLEICHNVQNIEGITKPEKVDEIRKLNNWKQVREYLLKHKTKEEQKDLERIFAWPLRQKAVSLLAKKNDGSFDDAKLKVFAEKNKETLQDTFLPDLLEHLGIKDHGKKKPNVLGPQGYINDNLRKIAAKFQLAATDKKEDFEECFVKPLPADDKAREAVEAKKKILEEKIYKDLLSWWNKEGVEGYFTEVAKNKIWATDNEIAALGAYFHCNSEHIKDGKLYAYYGAQLNKPITSLSFTNETNTHFDAWSDSALLNHAQGNFNKNNNTVSTKNDPVSAKIALNLPEQQKAIDELVDEHNKADPLKSWVKVNDHTVKVKGQELTLTDDGIRCKQLKDLAPEVQKEVIRAQVEIMFKRFQAAGINENMNVNLTLCEEDKKDPRILMLYQQACDEFGIGLNGKKAPVKTGLKANTSDTDNKNPEKNNNSKKDDKKEANKTSQKNKWESPGFDPIAHNAEIEKNEKDLDVKLEANKKKNVDELAQAAAKSKLEVQKAVPGANKDEIEKTKDAVTKAEKARIEEEIAREEVSILEQRVKVAQERAKFETHMLEEETKKYKALEEQLTVRKEKLKRDNFDKSEQINSKFVPRYAELDDKFRPASEAEKQQKEAEKAIAKSVIDAEKAEDMRKHELESKAAAELIAQDENKLVDPKQKVTHGNEKEKDAKEKLTALNAALAAAKKKVEVIAERNAKAEKKAEEKNDHTAAANKATP